MPIVQCSLCHNPVKKTDTQLKATKNPFCSYKCYHEWKRQHPSSPESRFWKKVNKQTGRIAPHMDTECWEWTGCKGSNGYGRFSHVGFNSRTILAHRFVYFLHHPDTPIDLHILHRCDNPSCVNPSHLFAGTNQDNIQDRMNKQRSYRGGAGNGEAHPRAKLTWEAVRYIRAHCYKTHTPREMAEKFAVDISNIHYVLKGEIWKE